MRSFTRVAALSALAGQAFGTVHHMFSGVFSGTDIYAIEFDDETNNLTLASSIVSEASSSKWIAIDERKQNIYVANGAQYDSYTITNSTGLEYSGTVEMSSNCSNANYIIASTASPYVVFGAPYSTGCPANMMSVDSTGTLTGIIANATYNSNAGIHGLALSADNQFLYSADDIGNAIWVHSVNITSGEIAEVQYLAAPTSDNPRHMVVHPLGNYAYVVFEEGNAIGVYSRDTTTGELTYTNTSYSLLPSTYSNTSSYWADEVQFSVNTNGTPSYMYAATRSRTTTIPGYVSAFSLDTSTGAIVEQLFVTETTGSGGSANSVTAAPFGEEYFAITDSGSNFVEVWMITANGTSSATGKAVAHLDLASGPSDVVWFD
ncbi:3-carboxy-cis,cis-mucoante lactonizing enzyme [Acephala macrosclerotiorum]|nr:3-carboxy-cis,cis-mucoante lactonizing enzyme [Acephala macrosclerotiorum]